LRRLWSILLLALFSFSLGIEAIGPALTADTDSTLPACCRRLGKHHCSMQAMRTTGEAIRSARCSSFPGSFAPALSPLGFVAMPAIALFALRSSSALVRYPARAWGLVSLGGSIHKRGPPSSPSFA
jgi:hypothetical protein